MNVLYYLEHFPKISESFILNEIYELERRGHNVLVFALHRSDEQIKHTELSELDIPIHYAETPTYSNVPELLSPLVFRPRILRNTVYRASVREHTKNLFRAKRCIEFLDDVEMDVDIVHTHFASKKGFGAHFVASFYDVPFTITSHAYDMFRGDNWRSASKLFQRSDRIITISEYNKRYIETHTGGTPPITVIRAGIRPEKFAPSESVVDKRILTVSRFVEKKGLEYAIEAISEVSQRIPDVEYHIVGSGPLETDLHNRVDRLEIESNVKFLHNVTDDRLIAEYDEARCFLLPCTIAESGDRDGIPVVLMEAMAMKTPPVSTTVSGIPELIDNERNGLLVDPRDADAIADAVFRVLQNDREWSRFRERAREKVTEAFDISDECDKLERAFEDAYEEH